MLPDGCVDVVVRDGRAMVAGPDTGPVEGVMLASAVVAGRALRARRRRAGLGVRADVLRDLRVPLEDLWGAAGRLVGERAGADPAALAAALARRLGRGPDPRVVAARPRCSRGRRDLPVPAVADAVGLGERQLRRAFPRAWATARARSRG